MKLKDLFVGLIGSIFIIPFFFTSCNNNDDNGGVSTKDTIVSVDTIYSSDTIFSVDTIYSSDTIYLTDEKIFMLDFSSDADPEDNTIWVTYSANVNSISEVPKVEVNGSTMVNFSTQGPVLYGNMEIPYSKGIQYSLSKGGESTTGSMVMPEITKATVNDTSMLGRYYITLPETNTFDVFIEFADQDYTRIYNQADLAWMPKQKQIINSNTYSLSIDTSDAQINYNNNWEVELYNLDVETYKGAGPLSHGLGITPNVTGDYGNGYVRALESAYLSNAEIDTSMSKAMMQKHPKDKRQDKRKDHVKSVIEDYKSIIRSINN